MAVGPRLMKREQLHFYRRLAQIEVDPGAFAHLPKSVSTPK
jgi:hypothetical protein